MVLHLLFGNNDENNVGDNNGCANDTRSETSCSSHDHIDDKQLSSDASIDKKKVWGIQLDNDDDGIDVGGGDDNMPSIEAVVSFSPTNSSVNSDEPHESTEEEEEEGVSPDAGDESEDIHSANASTHQHIFDEMDDDSCNLETLLTPRFYNDLMELQVEETYNKEMEREKRRQLLQNELDLIVGMAQRSLTEDDHELEPECIEALGIAANLVAYRRRYYDVAKCEYIYVPSVARCLLDGTLLEAAEPHYFGKFASPFNNGLNDDSSYKDFLVAYAATLGSTVLWSTKLRDLGYLHLAENELCEDVDLDDDDDDDDAYNTMPLSHQSHTQGPSPNVSVWSTPSNENVYINMSDRGVAQYFEFNESSINKHKKKQISGRLSRFVLKSTILLMMAVAVSSVFGYYYLLYSGNDPQEQILFLKQTLLRKTSIVSDAANDAFNSLSCMVRQIGDDKNSGKVVRRTGKLSPRGTKTFLPTSRQQRQPTKLTLRHSPETHSLTMPPQETDSADTKHNGVEAGSSDEGTPATRPIVPNLWY